MPARFLALGDSYTVGEGGAESDRWPVQLVALLRRNGRDVGEAEIGERTGWTTDELLAGIRAASPRGPYDLVSLLVGVNDQYHGRSCAEYAADFRELLERAIAFAGREPARVLVLSIPDWGVTPFAAGRDRAGIARELELFNAANLEASRSAGVRYVDVMASSRRAADDPGLLAPDGLHPSAALHAEWARLALPEALAAFGGRAGR